MFRTVAGLCGFVAVALGAFGAHALRPVLSNLATMDMWNTASLYHLVHSGVLVCLAIARPGARISFWLFVAGVVLFSGSLYLFALTGMKALTTMAPVGGLCLMGGWLTLAFGGGKHSAKEGDS